jgi:hypothetical protein
VRDTRYRVGGRSTLVSVLPTKCSIGSLSIEIDVVHKRVGWEGSCQSTAYLKCSAGLSFDVLGYGIGLVLFLVVGVFLKRRTIAENLNRDAWM